MKYPFLKIVPLALLSLSMFSCASTNWSMREPNTKVIFNKSDFSLSEQVSEDASSVKILSIDWSRIFNRKTGTIEGGDATIISLANIPVIGTVLSDKTANYALYKLMMTNPGYDVVFYPQYNTKVSKPFLGLGFIYKSTKVHTTARLGKLND